MCLGRTALEQTSMSEKGPVRQDYRMTMPRFLSGQNPNKVGTASLSQPMREGIDYPVNETLRCRIDKEITKIHLQTPESPEKWHKFRYKATPAEKSRHGGEEAEEEEDFSSTALR